MRLGRLGHSEAALAKAPQLATHRFAAMPPPPAVDRGAVPFQPRLFDNDTLPDCTAAALANAALAVSALNGFEAAIADTAIPAFYAACIGMQGATAAQLAVTEGAIAIEVLERQLTRGFDVGQDAPLTGLYGVLPLAPSSLATAIAHVGPGYWGVTLTARDMDNAASAEPWDDDGSLDPGPIAGGHMLMAWDYAGLAETDTLRLATWGRFKLATWRWVRRRLDEAYGLVWRQLSTVSGTDLGVDVARLEAELNT